MQLMTHRSSPEAPEEAQRVPTSRMSLSHCQQRCVQWPKSSVWLNEPCAINFQSQSSIKTMDPMSPSIKLPTPQSDEPLSCPPKLATPFRSSYKKMSGTVRRLDELSKASPSTQLLKGEGWWSSQRVPRTCLEM